jgi:hypothetical protein
MERIVTKKEAKTLAIVSVPVGLMLAICVAAIPPKKPPPTFESMKAACALAPDPDECLAEAIVKVDHIEELQRDAVKRAEQ